MPTFSIDEHKLIEKVVSRLFSGRMREVLGEILQNSQRAGATRVNITFLSATSCDIVDDGHGLMQGMESLRNLLVLAESYFSDPRVEREQKPVGVGFHSLLVQEGISRVVIQSGLLELEIDTKRWIHDRDYWATWEERVKLYDAARGGGFRLHIEGRAVALEEMRQCLLHGNTVYDLYNYQRFLERYNPVAGYAEILDVYLDGKPISATLPDAITLPQPDIIAEYKGNMIRIAMFPEEGYSGLFVDWHGQAIPNYGWNGLRVYLIVREGCPVTPQAPTRNSLIEDDALLSLRVWVEDTVFAWVCSQDNPSAKYVKRCYELYPARAIRECPFTVVQMWKQLPHDYEFVSSEHYRNGGIGTLESESDERGPETVLRKSELPSLLLLDEEVTCLLPRSHQAQPYEIQKAVEEDSTQKDDLLPVHFEIGLTSLLAATGIVAYRAGVGVPEDAINSFWWKPGAMLDRYHTTDLGSWTIQSINATEDAVSSAEWTPLLHEAFVVETAESFTIDYTSWIIGLYTTAHMVPFLYRCARAGFLPDEYKEEESEEDYNDSVHRLVCTYLPDTLGRYTSIVDLVAAAKPILPPQYSALDATMTFLHEGGWIQGVRLTFPGGYAKDIKFF